MIFAKLNYCFVDISGCVIISCGNDDDDDGGCCCLLLTFTTSHCVFFVFVLFIPHISLTKAKRFRKTCASSFKCEKILLFTESLADCQTYINEILCTCLMFFFLLLLYFKDTDKTKSISWANKLLFMVLHSFHWKLVQN